MIIHHPNHCHTCDTLQVTVTGGDKTVLHTCTTCTVLHTQLMPMPGNSACVHDHSSAFHPNMTAPRQTEVTTVIMTPSLARTMWFDNTAKARLHTRGWQETKVHSFKFQHLPDGTQIATRARCTQQHTVSASNSGLPNCFPSCCYHILCCRKLSKGRLRVHVRNTPLGLLDHQQAPKNGRLAVQVAVLHVAPGSSRQSVNTAWTSNMSA